MTAAIRNEAAHVLLLAARTKAAQGSLLRGEEASVPARDDTGRPRPPVSPEASRFTLHGLLAACSYETRAMFSASTLKRARVLAGEAICLAAGTDSLEEAAERHRDKVAVAKVFQRADELLLANDRRLKVRQT